jgi:uncharacterized FlaG/YvyC family protein
MSFQVPPLSGADKVLGSQQVKRTEKPQPTSKVESTDSVRLDTIPSQPPESLHAEMDRAAKRVDELKADGRELRFDRDKDTGRVVVQVRDLDGNVLRTIPPSKLLDVAAGGSLD